MRNWYVEDWLIILQLICLQLPDINHPCQTWWIILTCRALHENKLGRFPSYFHTAMSKTLSIFRYSRIWFHIKIASSRGRLAQTGENLPTNSAIWVWIQRQTGEDVFCARVNKSLNLDLSNLLPLNPITPCTKPKVNLTFYQLRKRDT